MATLSKTAFETKYNDGSTGLYRAGQATGAIGSDDHRTQIEDTSDSVMFIEDYQIYVASVSISSAEILALNATPKTLISAPGAGKIIDVISAEIYLDYNSIAYATNIALWISYNAASAQLHTTSFNIAAATQDYFSKINLDDQSAFGTAVRVNTPLVAYVDTGNPTAGNSTIKVFLTYRIITI